MEVIHWLGRRWSASPRRGVPRLDALANRGILRGPLKEWIDCVCNSFALGVKLCAQVFLGKGG